MYRYFGLLYFGLLSGLSANGMSKHQDHKTNTDSQDIVYEVYVQSFCDSNGDGIGDLPGLISKLDYIRDLGANTLWMMPIHPSPSYHKYDVTDYYAIHPDFGTMADMDLLIAEATKRNMKIILDLVVNHTSAEHPWFIASSSSPGNPFRDYYVWKNFDAVKDEIEKKETTFDSDNLTQWHEWPGQDERYYGFFWKGMPDLNFDYAPVRQEIYKIGKFWLDKGIDGFRLDAAKHIYPDDQLDDTRKFWEEFTTEMRKINPDVKIIGEVWADPHTLSGFFKGLPSLFNFELTKAIPECIQGSDANRFMTAYTTIQDAYRSAIVPFEDAILLSNHDMNRIRSTLGGEIEKAKLAASILLTIPGTPYVYYGEELGMLGIKPDIHLREPYPWGDQSTPDATWEMPKYSIPPDVKSLKEQASDAKSIYQHYKKWIKLRMDYPDVATGPLVFRNMQNNNLLAYTYKTKRGTLWIVHNLSGEKIKLPLKNKAFDASTNKNMKVGDEIMLAPYGSAFITMEK